MGASHDWENLIERKRGCLKRIKTVIDHDKESGRGYKKGIRNWRRRERERPITSTTHAPMHTRRGIIVYVVQ